LSSILDQIKIDFKWVGVGKSLSGINPNDKTKFSNFIVKISYNNKSARIPYSIANVDDLSMKKFDLLKIDLVGRIVIDCYPFKTITELKSCLIKKGYKEDDEFYEQLFEDVKAQARKFRTLFTEYDLMFLKTELRDWFDRNPQLTKQSPLEIRK
jgi:hypothetical protein